uniref:Dicarboxylate transport n=1 Tax=Candidatus Kentrum sp. FM TaxID=2126340 RepID=A0A450WDF5_9GAMM|nr:MAG: Dicarboxylate transport [Candidatus Kentron sp. FM]VFJ63346.1 MAG: Dicarboxylate transport [Candidatus Kentron sp. FM]VFK15073.1 MAG: Dicarboxylate transport [Candidatus Kentron sp. FM]
MFSRSYTGAWKREGKSIVGLPVLITGAWERGIGLHLLIIVLVMAGLVPSTPIRADELAIESLSMDPMGTFHAHLGAARIEPGKDGFPLEAEDLSIHVEGRLPSSAPGPLFEGRITLESRRLVLNGSEFHGAEIDFDGTLDLATGGPVTGMDLAGDLTLSFSERPSHDAEGRRLEHRVKRISFGQVASKLQWDEQSLKISGDLVFETVPLHFHLTHRFHTRDGELKLDAGSVAASRFKTGLSSILSTWSETAWPKALSLISGRVFLAATLPWNAKKGVRPLMASIRLADVAGCYSDLPFSGLKGRFDTIIGPRMRVKTSGVSCNIVDIGVPITALHGAMTVDRRPNKAPAVVANLEAEMLGGHVLGERIELDFNRKVNRFDLELRELDIAQLVALYPLDGLQADGKLGGNLPFRLDSGGLHVHDGAITAVKPGGRIRYRPTDGGQALAGSAGQMALLFGVLEDFRYHALEATTNYAPDGTLQTHIAFKGEGVRIDGGMGRPVHFNLDVEQNILPLLKSLRVVNDINEHFDKSIRHRCSPTAKGGS